MDSLSTEIDLAVVPPDEVAAYRAHLPDRAGPSARRTMRDGAGFGARERALGSVSEFAAGTSQLREMTRPQKRRHQAKLQRTIRALRPLARPATCLTRQAFRRQKGAPGPAVEVVDGGRARWARLHRCGSAWACPHCAPILSEARRDELVTGLKTWRRVLHKPACAQLHARGLTCSCEPTRGVALVTLTNAHGRADVLAELVAKQGDALRWLSSQRKYKDLRADYGVAHVVRSAEVTWGEANGWHPHHHFVWLTEKPLTEDDARDIGDRLHALWARACAKFGLGAPDRAHGVDVGLGSRPDEYVTKWGAAEELTLGRVKVGRLGALSPWGLLQRAHDGDVEAGKRWCEFLAAYAGRAQLFWSRGMRKALGIGEELTEEQLLEKQAAQDRITHTVPVSVAELNAVMRLGLREKFLDLVEGLAQLESLRPEDVERAGRTFAQEAHSVLRDWCDAQSTLMGDRTVEELGDEAGLADLFWLRRENKRIEAALEIERTKLRAEVIARTERSLAA